MEHDRDHQGSQLPKFPGYPVNESRDAAEAADARRVEREEAFHQSGKVAGHDFRRENAEHERERER